MYFKILQVMLIPWSVITDRSHLCFRHQSTSAQSVNCEVKSVFFSGLTSGLELL